MDMLRRHHSGFTIIELVVVIAVIGILAAVTVVGYGAWRNSTQEAQLKSELSTAAQAMESARNFSNGYPSTIPSTYTPSEGVTLVLTVATLTEYCIDGISTNNPSAPFYIYSMNSAQGAVSGTCAERPNSNPSSAYGSLAVGTSIEGYWITPPTGYLLEDGSPVSRSTYAALFAVIGVTYGEGDGVSTFNLPDSRGRVGVNKSSDVEFATIGQKTGSKTETLTLAQIPSHSHRTGISGTVAGSYQAGSSSAQVTFSQTTGLYTAPAGGGGSHNNIQPSIVKNAAIRFAPPDPATATMPVATSINGYWSSAPSDYLLEDGSAVSRTTYSALFSAIGTTYGAGDGSTTFNLPDSRGRVGVNKSADVEFASLGQKYGEKQHTLTIAEIPSHSHQTGISGTNAGNYAAGSSSAVVAFDQSSGILISSAGGDGSHNEIQPSIVKLSAIKVTPASGTGDPVVSGTSVSGYWTATPPGYLLEDGSAVSRTTYSALFSAIGTTYGAGDGSTTFNLPDSRGRVGVNKSSDVEFATIGQKTGSKTETLTLAQIPSHSHQTGISASVAGSHYAGSASAQVTFSQTTGLYTAPAGGGGSHNNIQPSIVKQFIIKS